MNRYEEEIMQATRSGGGLLTIMMLAAGLFAAGLSCATNAAPAPHPTNVRSFRDCPDCPLMVVTPPGSFVMGSPPDQTGRGTDED